MSIHYFEYDGQRSDALEIGSKTVELAFGYFQAYEPPLNMVREMMVGSINRHRLKANAMGTKWSNVLSFQLSLIKSPCSDQEDFYFTEDEIDYIDAWLTSPNYPTLLHIYEAEKNEYLENPELYSDSLYLKYDYFGVFTEIQPTYSGDKIIGLTATFSTNSPFAWSKPKTITAECRGTDDEPATVEIVVDSSEKYGEIYPLIEIVGVNVSDETTPGDDSGGTEPSDSGTEEPVDYSVREDITITNTMDINLEYEYDEEQHRTIPVATPRSLSLQVPHAPIYVDSEKSRIYDIVSVLTEEVNHILDWEDLGLEDVSYIYWPRLFHGKNVWEVSGNCNITITFREPRKVGAY